MTLAGRFWPLAVLLAVSSLAMTRKEPTRKLPSPPRLMTRLAPTVLTVDTRFAPLEQARCSAFLPPRLVSGHAAKPANPVEVDFIVGRNGQVEKPFLLEGTDSAVKVVSVIRAWHYRPALCDGLPVEAEGRVKLGSQSRN